MVVTMVGASAAPELTVPPVPPLFPDRDADDSKKVLPVLSGPAGAPKFVQ